MQNRKIQIIVGSGIFALILLISVQFIWARSLVSLEKKQFNHKVKIALNNTAYRLRMIQQKGLNNVHPVKQINERSFVITSNEILNPVTVDSVLSKELDDLEVSQEYKLAIYDCFTNTVAFCHRANNKAEVVKAEQYALDWDTNSYNIGIDFYDLNHKSEALKVWIVGLIVIVIVCVFFVIVVQTLIKQKRLDEMKTDFINNMTHELKTPISTISLSSQVISNPKIVEHPDRLLRYANIIKDENNRLKDQVERVLKMAFYEKQDLPLNIQQVDIKGLVEKAVQPYELKLNEREGSVTISGNTCTINIDEQHIQNVFSNLIDNAIKYCAQKPQIRINVECDEKGATLSFSDNGIGMSKEEARNIFKKFYRVPTGDKHDVKGFGIGLSYVQLMIEKHNGSIDVTSEKGKGTTFVIYLPNNLK